MIVLGLDPGTRRTGYAVLKLRGMQPEILDLGVFHLPENLSLGVRLENLHAQATQLLQRHNPRWIGLEKAVTFKNVASSLKLSEARGVLRLAMQQQLAEAHERLIELSPTTVKRHAAGLGLAAKQDVTRVLCLRFPSLAGLLRQPGLTHDAFDALAIAWSAWVESKKPRIPAKPKLGSLER